jgi:riboflavin synthase alpha subunit
MSENETNQTIHIYKLTETNALNIGSCLYVQDNITGHIINKDINNHESYMYLFF